LIVEGEEEVKQSLRKTVLGNIKDQRGLIELVDRRLGREPKRGAFSIQGIGGVIPPS